MRSLSGASLGCVAMLALGSLTSTVGCAKVGEIQSKKAFKAANAAYQQQDYKKAAEFYEETIAAAPDTPTAHQAYFLPRQQPRQPVQAEQEGRRRQRRAS